MNARTVAVMGAGTMGSGIAAHLANLGFDVILLDLTRESCQAGFDRALKMKPAHFNNHEAASRVRIASITDELTMVSEADWVCEAIIEQMDAKRELYAAIEPVLRDDAMISTNTSGLEIRLLAEECSPSFKKRFMGTHFFNPPRYLKLIELIPTNETDSDAVAKMTTFLEDKVGRRVVLAKDTPGFIANRYGMWVLLQAIHTAEKLKFSVEMVDTLTGPFLGRPKTATFRLADLIGLDIIQDVASNLLQRCEHDPRRANLQLPVSIANLITLGWIGAKAGQGFYKKEGDQFLNLDFSTKAYRPRFEPDLPRLAQNAKLPLGERIRKTLEESGEEGEFLREHLVPSLLYATEIGQEISYSVRDFDNVMKWGWGWQAGPFELIDEIGVDSLRKFAADAPLLSVAPFYSNGAALGLESLQKVPAKQDERFIQVSELPVTNSGPGWNIRDDGRGGFVFEFTSKMNALSPAVVNALQEHLDALGSAPITLANEGPAFSVGYDLTTILKVAEEENFEQMRTDLLALQACGAALAKVSSSAGLHGYALGGGLELAMHCRTAVAHPEAQLGLPEVLVGLVPAGGGTTMMRKRSQGDIRAMCTAAMNLAAGRKVMACDGYKAHYLRETDVLAVNPDQLTYAAITAPRAEIAEAEWLATPPPLAGMIDGEIEKLRAAGEIGEYGSILAMEVKQIFVRAKSEQEALEMEVEAFLRLLGKPRTQMRIRHMLEKGRHVNN